MRTLLAVCFLLGCGGLGTKATSGDGGTIACGGYANLPPCPENTECLSTGCGKESDCGGLCYVK